MRKFNKFRKTKKKKRCLMKQDRKTIDQFLIGKGTTKKSHQTADYDSVHLGWSMRYYISNKLPDDASEAVLVWTTH